jgi:hypothetical protein
MREMVQLQRKYLLLIAIVCGLFAAGLAQPAGAVIDGTVDGTAHRYVGAHVVLDEAGGIRQVVPSGVLVAPTVMVVAGHSVFFGNAGSLAEQGRLFVSFAPTVDPTSTAGLIKVVHAEGLFPTLDIGVFILAEPAHDAQGSITPAQLPPGGLLDQLAAAHELHGLPLTLVGYGASALIDKTPPPSTPDFSTFGTRRSGLQRAQALPHGEAAAPFGTLPVASQLQVSTNVTTPTLVTPGIGDSGAPYLLEGSDTVVGILSMEPGALLEASVWAATRLDTPEARSFLARFGVPLP